MIIILTNFCFILLIKFSVFGNTSGSVVEVAVLVSGGYYLETH